MSSNDNPRDYRVNYGAARITVTEVGDEVAALQQHYPHRTRSEAEETRFLRDFCDVLGGKDAEAFRAAMYRMKADTKRKKMPTPGEVLALVLELSPRANRPAVAAVERNAPWRPASEAELAAMPPWAARREHLILVAHYLGKAGPMWWNGEPCRPEDMPPDRAERWAENTRKAAWHQQAADGLRAQMIDSRMRREEDAQHG